jgi:hypothetical protein
MLHAAVHIMLAFWQELPECSKPLQLAHGLSACIKAHEQLIGQAFQLLHLT